MLGVHGRLISVLAAAVCASAAGPALAAPTSPVSAQALQAAQTFAQSYWGATPCAGRIAISWMTLSPGTNATSTWTNPAGQYADAPSNTACAIAFNAALSWDWPKLCSVVTHEYGHLLGHAHSSVTADVMYPYYLAPIAGCAQLIPRWLRGAKPRTREQAHRHGSR